MDRSELLQRAKLAEKTERYEDCAKYMSELVREQGQLKDEEERKLLMTSYKKVLEAKTTALKTLASIEQQDSIDPEVMKEYEEEVQKDLHQNLREIYKLLNVLIRQDCEESGMEILVYYITMQADFLMYCVDAAGGVSKEGMIHQIRDLYEKAMDYGHNLPATNPILLGLYLNMSVFLHELDSDTDAGVRLAARAHGKAVRERDMLKEDLHPDSTAIMKQLQDNVTLWRGEVP